MKKTSFFIFFSLILCSLQAQKIQIKALVLNQKNQPVDYFNAVLLNTKDSSLILGGAFLDGKLLINAQQNKDYLLKISGVEYKKKWMKIKTPKSGNLDLGTIKLQEQQLEQVDVIAKRPIYKRNGQKMIMLVKSSSLSHAGSLSDVLRRSPGITVSKDNSISVQGRGNVLVFIDGRELSSNNELSSIVSSNIKDIVIDKFPGAKYPANVDCVIKITTIKVKSSLNIYIDNYQSHKLSSNPGINMNILHKKWKNYFDFNFDLSNALFGVIDSTQNFHDSKNVFYTATKDTLHEKMRVPYIFYGTRYDFNKNTNVQFQYNYYQQKTNDQTPGVQTIGDNFYTQKRTLYKESQSNNYVHNLDFIFETKIWKGDFSLISDFNQTNNKEIDSIAEKNETWNKTYSTNVNNNTNYKVYTLRTNYHFLAGKNTGIDIGSKYSSTFDLTKSSWKNTTTDYQNRNLLNDKITAFYINFNTKLKGIDVTGGLRTEQTQRLLAKNDVNFLDSSYWNVYPSFSANYAINKQLSLNLSYMYKVRRPAFWKLDPSVLFFDSLNYRVGNPALKSFNYQDLSLGASLFNNLNFNLIYIKLYNYTSMVTQADEQNPKVMKFIPKNFKEATKYSFTMDYNYSGKKYNFYVSAGTNLLLSEIPYETNSYTTNKPNWYIETDHNFDFNKHLNAYLNFSYTSAWYSFSSYQLPTYSIDAGVQLKMLKDKFLVNIDMYDMLHTSEAGGYLKYGYYRTFEYFDHELRYLDIRLSYNFNDFRQSFNKKSANSSELNRL